MLELYDLCGKDNIRFSPPCWTVKLCLLHKQISFKTVPVGLSEKNKIAFSNQSLLPILKDTNIFVCDSWQIINWLEENYKEKPLFINTSSHMFSTFLFHWSSKQLLPELFKIIANDIPNILEGDDLKYYIKTREEYIKAPLSTLKPLVASTTIKFRKMINPVRKILKNKDYIAGDKPGLEDYIFFGNFQWIKKCSDYQLLEDDDLITNWFNNIVNKFNLKED